MNLSLTKIKNQIIETCLKYLNRSNSVRLKSRLKFLLNFLKEIGSENEVI